MISTWPIKPKKPKTRSADEEKETERDQATISLYKYTKKNNRTQFKTKMHCAAQTIDTN